MGLKQNNNESFVDDVVTPPPVLNPMQYNYIERTPKQLNALDRVYNPLRYPYKGRDFYNQNWRPNLALPPQVVGCGGRNTPCLGGSQVPIANPMYLRPILSLSLFSRMNWSRRTSPSLVGSK